MEKALEEKLEKADEELNWSGLSTESMVEVTEYTLEKLKEYLDELDVSSEANTIQGALDLIDTHLQI